MSIAISNRESVGAIFRGNKFLIPSYQRSYSWSNDENNNGQLKDLWDDITDANGKMTHFFGTLIFKEGAKLGLTEIYEIIDGQQRLTTLYLLLDVLINKLPDTLSTGETKEEYRKTYIGTKENMKLTPMGKDAEFMRILLFDFEKVKELEIERRSQKLLYEAKKYFTKLLVDYKPHDVENLIRFIQNQMEVLVLNVKHEDEAIKMFSIINDRGLPLKVLDKTKSTLMFYSTRYLDNSENEYISENFEKVFDAYDDILHYKEFAGVLNRFGENTLFTFHYLTLKNKFFADSWNYRNGAEAIFENLKKKLNNLKDNKEELAPFIHNYVDDFSSFSESLAKLVKIIPKTPAYTLPFQFLDFNAVMYPLIVRLYMQNKLDDLLMDLEKTELRVYNVNTTGPVADIYTLCSAITAETWEVEDISAELHRIIGKFMNDSDFKTYLTEGVYNKRGTKYMLLVYNNSLNDSPILDFRKYKTLQEEHIFSQNPNFDVTEYQFKDSEEYNKEKHKLGNLTLYEPDNSNDIPINKADKYLNAGAFMTRKLGAKIKQDNRFSKQEVLDRGLELASYLLKRF